MAVLVDTGPLVASLDRRDVHHPWTISHMKQLAAPLHTCEAVFAEAFHLLARVPQGRIELLNLLDRNLITTPFRYRDHAGRIHDIMRQYADLPIDFTDACLVRMAELDETARVFTIDSDFYVYRAHGDRMIDVIMPD